VGSPLALYNAPVNRFVAGFIGSPRMNFVEGKAGEVSPGSIEFVAPGLPPVRLPAAATRSVKTSDPLTLGIRAEHVAFGEGGWHADLEVAEHYGASSYLHCRLLGGAPFLVHEPGQSSARRGDRLALLVPPERCHLFGADENAIAAGAAA
jgi:ABC-type sugar transport system ATPase subunit